MFQQLAVGLLLGVTLYVTDPEGLRGLLTASSPLTMMLIVHSSSPLTRAECTAVVSYLGLLKSPKAP